VSGTWPELRLVVLLISWIGECAVFRP
jgi:hypothetical protein